MARVERYGVPGGMKDLIEIQVPLGNQTQVKLARQTQKRVYAQSREDFVG